MARLSLLPALAAALFAMPAAPDPGATPEPDRPWVTGTCRSTPIPQCDEKDPEVRKYLQAFEYELKDFTWKIRPGLATDRVRIHELRIESPVVTPVVENNTIHGFFYEPVPRPAEKRPAAVVLHHLGGEFTAEEMLARRLAEEGIPSAFMLFPYYEKRWPAGSRAPGVLSEDIDRSLGAMRQAVLDIHRLGDWLAQRPEVDPQRLCLVGVSLGACIGGLAGGVDPTFAKLALIMAGGDLPGILFNNPEIKHVQEKVIDRGYTLEKVQALLRPVEPLVFAHRVNPRNVLLLNARNDEIIPKRFTQELWKAMGKPTVRWYNAGHYTISMYFPDLIAQVTQHFQAPVLPREAPADDGASSVREGE